MQLVNLEIDNRETLIESFNLQHLQLVRIEDSYPLLVYIIKLNELDSIWENINFSLSQSIKDYLNEYNKWNMYLFFISEENISKMLQYKIENDTLAFRKIIESNYENELNEENIKSLISKHILFTDLEINTSNIELQNHTSPSELWKNISSIEDVNDENIDSILENLEGLAYEN